MSYIPDCREDGTYNEKYLNGKDKEFIRGFDWATQMAVDNFFDNGFGDIGVESDFLDTVLRTGLPEHLKDEYEMESTFHDGKPVTYEARKVETYGDLIRFKLLEWIEAHRNELITSMIDGMDEKEYGEIKTKVDAGQSKAEN